MRHDGDEGAQTLVNHSCSRYTAYITHSLPGSLIIYFPDEEVVSQSLIIHPYVL